MKEFDTILKENDIVAKNDYWAYPNNMKLYQYSSKKVGIKIHLSATVLNYKVIVKRFLKWNIKYKVGFKVSKSLKVLEELNSGVLGYSQTGKFLTLYPIQNSKYINKILISLYKMYNDINSVDIPSDTPFLNSSVVYIRYGEFKPNHKFYTDNRDGYIPQNIKRKITALNFTSYFTIPKHFKILNMIRKSSKGGVFIAWDENINKLVLLKEATKNAQMTLSGRDSVLSLYEEINLLKGMNREGYSFIPKYINAFWVNNSLFLEESYIPGKTLDEIIRNDLKERKQVMSNFKNILLIIHKLHKFDDYIIHDISPANIIFYNKRFYLIDFESFSKSEVKVSTLYGTRGFFDNDYDMNDQTIDYFALARVYYFLRNAKEYRQLSEKRQSFQLTDSEIQKNLWFKKCMNHSYKNDEDWLVDYEKYVGIKQ